MAYQKRMLLGKVELCTFHHDGRDIVMMTFHGVTNDDDDYTQEVLLEESEAMNFADGLAEFLIAVRSRRN